MTVRLHHFFFESNLLRDSYYKIQLRMIMKGHFEGTKHLIQAGLPKIAFLMISKRAFQSQKNAIEAMRCYKRSWNLPRKKPTFSLNFCCMSRGRKYKNDYDHALVSQPDRLVFCQTVRIGICDLSCSETKQKIRDFRKI